MAAAAAAADEDKYPKVQGGGSLILAWQIRNKHVLVVGGGEVAAGRILNVLNADAHVTVVCPSEGLNPEVRYRVAMGQIRHIDRVFQPSDLESLPLPNATTTNPPSNDTNNDQNHEHNYRTENDKGDASETTTAAAPAPTGPPDMVMCAIDDPAASTQVWKLCKKLRIPANIADVPPECDFYFGAVHRDGPLQIMVSTNGRGPRLAASIRNFIARSLPTNVGDAITKVGELRGKLRQVAPNIEEGPKRMRWITRVSDKYSWNDITRLSEEDMDNLLKFYPENKVPELDVLKAMRAGGADGGWDPELVDIFDGSFGFSVGI